MKHPTSKRVGLILTMAALGVTALAGCIPASGDTAAESTDTALTGSAQQSALQTFYRQKPTWTTCGELQCATLTVPVDYAHPETGQTFTLPLARSVTADPARRMGSLVFNPGGPGESGVEQLKSGGLSFFSERARARFDIVSFDPRGVAGSKPAVDCGSSDFADQDQPESDSASMSAYPKTAAERSAALADAEKQVASCKARSGAILLHVGTLDAARDMDVLRAALGDEKLSYLGWSYGTYLGTVYGELFPHRVRALALDGAVDPSLDWSEATLQQGKAFRKSVDDYAQKCATVVHDACPATTPDGIHKVITDLHRRTAKHPLPINGTTERLDQNMLLTALTKSMYTPESQWQDLSEALRAARGGDGTKLAEIASPGISAQPAQDDSSDPGSSGGQAPDNSSVAITAVNCLDQPHPRDAQPYWELLERANQEAGVFGTSAVLAELTCKDWPTGQQQPHRVNAKGLPPALVVGTTGDPATPYPWSQGLAAQLPGGMLLTFKGSGHTAYGRSNACVDDAVDAYLIDLKPVPSGTAC
ncbi:alpha/beta hydrolase [Streptomyces sp. SP17BM10]|uniref:alpha/beta hydrolase n=1 Tax=Streptomyces sp. SP17BM10 TaxID=3002530 RepID=UPI002E7759CC|nr:alpha/beta hydrolase [Streptomyces sp. SP17BM10]MEE1783404.1 alpha/beta hydrolase [Streptomyces sp. SP17BM10]